MHTDELVAPVRLEGVYGVAGQVSVLNVGYDDGGEERGRQQR
jgi:hypothetical protein